MTIPAPPEYDRNADLTPPHFFDPDTQDSTSCLFCGSADGYGVLHLSEPVDLLADPGPPPECAGCGHWLHDRGQCRVVVNRSTKQVCGCKAKEAAA